MNLTFSKAAFLPENLKETQAHNVLNNYSMCLKSVADGRVWVRMVLLSWFHTLDSLSKSCWRRSYSSSCCWEDVDCQKTCSWVSNVWLSVNGCLFMCQPCDGLAMSPGCTLPPAQWLLGLAPSPREPYEEKRALSQITHPHKTRWYRQNVQPPCSLPLTSHTVYKSLPAVTSGQLWHRITQGMYLRTSGAIMQGPH